MINRIFVVQYKCSKGARQCLAPVIIWYINWSIFLLVLQKEGATSLLFSYIILRQRTKYTTFISPAKRRHRL